MQVQSGRHGVWRMKRELMHKERKQARATASGLCEHCTSIPGWVWCCRWWMCPEKVPMKPARQAGSDRGRQVGSKRWQQWDQVGAQGRHSKEFWTTQQITGAQTAVTFLEDLETTCCHSSSSCTSELLDSLWLSPASTHPSLSWDTVKLRRKQHLEAPSRKPHPPHKEYTKKARATKNEQKRERVRKWEQLSYKWHCNRERSKEREQQRKREREKGTARERE